MEIVEHHEQCPRPSPAAPLNFLQWSLASFVSLEHVTITEHQHYRSTRNRHSKTTCAPHVFLVFLFALWTFLESLSLSCNKQIKAMVKASNTLSEWNTGNCCRNVAVGGWQYKVKPVFSWHCFPRRACTPQHCIFVKTSVRFTSRGKQSRD